MPLPRWEPTWIAGEAIDNVLDYGQAQPEHPSWENEPTRNNLTHIVDHVQTFYMALLDGEQPDMTDLTHAMTRLAMEYAKVQQWMRDKLCNDYGHFFHVGKGRCVCGLRDRMVVVGQGLPEKWLWKALVF